MTAGPGIRDRRRGVLHTSSVVGDAGALPASLTRHRGGTYSPTVGRIRTATGETVLTDLIRLTPNVDAYSLDFHGHSPRFRGHYRPAGWDAAPTPEIGIHESEIVWILLHSYPTLDTAALSARLRAAGVDLGPADIPIHEAIAATQAALWHFTDGIRLAGAVPSWQAPDAAALRTWSGSRVRPGAPLRIELRFSGEPRVTGYTVEFAGDVPAAATAALERSNDGESWIEIPSSRTALADAATLGRLVKGLGAGATTSRTSHGRSYGYDRYRLVVESPTVARIAVTSISLDFADASARSNSERVLALCRHLVDGARNAAALRSPLRAPTVVLRTDDGPVGPFVFDASAVDRARVVARDEAGVRLDVVDEDGRLLDRVGGGVPFFVAPAAGAERGDVVVTGEVEAGHAHRGMLLLGEATGSGNALTTLGLVSRRAAAGVAFSHRTAWRASAASVASAASARR